MANPTQLTVHLNNRGVAYLEKGNLHKSFNLFREALRNTMALLRETPELTQQDDLAVSSSRVSLPIWKTKGLKAFASKSASLKHNDHTLHTLNHSSTSKVSSCDFLFAQGITLMEESGAYSLNNVVDITVASSIVLFNLALIHHIKGLKESCSSKYLIKAESFYCRSYQLLVDTGLDLGRSGNPVIDFLSMALLNNCAQVGRELCHSELSQQQFRRLLRVATQVNSNSYGNGAIASFMEETKNDFLLNAIVLCDQSRAAAA